jgi:hypothetical protein
MGSLPAVVVAGICARTAADRFKVAMAVLDRLRLVEHTVLPAAAAEPLTRQLAELRVRAHELFEAHRVEAIALWQVDPPVGGGVRLRPTLIAGQAEGAVLAAAGELGIEAVRLANGATVRAAGGGRTVDAVKTLAGALAGLPASGDVARAAAVARACSLRGGFY